jgi:hypothetical protein
MKEGYSIEVQDRTSNPALNPEDIRAYDMAWLIDADKDTTPQLQNRIGSANLSEAESLSLLPVWLSVASPPYAETLNTGFDELGVEGLDKPSPIGFNVTQSPCRSTSGTETFQLTELGGIHVVPNYPTDAYSLSVSADSAPIDIDRARDDTVKKEHLKYWAQTSCGDLVYQTTPTAPNERRGFIADSAWLLSAPARDTSQQNLDFAVDIADWMLNHW